MIYVIYEQNKAKRCSEPESFAKTAPPSNWNFGVLLYAAGQDVLCYLENIRWIFRVTYVTTRCY